MDVMDDPIVAKWLSARGYKKLRAATLLSGIANCVFRKVYEVVPIAFYSKKKTRKTSKAYLWKLQFSWKNDSQDYAWMISNNVGAFSFLSLCEEFGYEPDEIRAKILKRPPAFFDEKRTIRISCDVDELRALRRKCMLEYTTHQKHTDLRKQFSI
jgi:hypothetical protein